MHAGSPARQPASLVCLEYKLCDGEFQYAVITTKTTGTSELRRLVISLLPVVAPISPLPLV